MKGKVFGIVIISIILFSSIKCSDKPQNNHTQEITTKYKYIETVIQISTNQNGEKKEIERKITDSIEATNDIDAYLQAYSLFCTNKVILICQSAFDDFISVRFDLINDEGVNIMPIANFPEREDMEKPLWEHALTRCPSLPDSLEQPRFVKEYKYESYFYDSIVSLLGTNTLTHPDLKIIIAGNDEEAYLQGYLQFCAESVAVDLNANGEVILSSFSVIGADGNDIQKTATFKDKEKKKKEMWSIVLENMKEHYKDKKDKIEEIEKLQQPETLNLDSISFSKIFEMSRI